MGLGQCISNTVLLDLLQLCEIDEKQYNMGPLRNVKIHETLSGPLHTEYLTNQ